MKQSFNCLLVSLLIVHVQIVIGAENFKPVSSVCSCLNCKRKTRFDELPEKVKKESFDQESDELFRIYLGVKLKEIGISGKCTPELCKCHMHNSSASKPPFIFPAGFNLNQIFKSEKFSLLTAAVRFAHHELVTLLVDAGADVALPDGRGVTPLQEAFSLRDVTVKGGFRSITLQDRSEMIVLLQQYGARLSESLAL